MHAGPKNQPPHHQTYGLNYTLEFSGNLQQGSWNPVSPDTVSVVPHPTDPALEFVTLTAPLSTAATGFYRLAVSGHE